MKQLRLRCAVMRYGHDHKQRRLNLLRAAEDGGCDRAEALLAAGVDADTRNPGDNCSPLHLAAQSGHLGMAVLLLDYGATIKARTNGGYTPLHWAASNGRTDMVRLLLKHDADIEARSNDGFTPLLSATRGLQPAIMRALLEAGAYWDVQAGGEQYPGFPAETLTDVLERARTAAPGRVRHWPALACKRIVKAWNDSRYEVMFLERTLCRLLNIPGGRCAMFAGWLQSPEDRPAQCPECNGAGRIVVQCDDLRAVEQVGECKLWHWHLVATVDVTIECPGCWALTAARDGRFIADLYQPRRAHDPDEEKADYFASEPAHDRPTQSSD